MTNISSKWKVSFELYDNISNNNVYSATIKNASGSRFKGLIGLMQNKFLDEI